MKIAIDLRSLSTGSISGVENYTLNVVESLLKLDKKNEYKLFYNSFYSKNLPEFHYVNSSQINTGRPNKILNLQLKFDFANLENFLGPMDWFFMPNLNQFSVSTKTKVAITVHDLSPLIAPEFYNAKRRIWHWFLNYKKAFLRADLIFAVSEYTKNDLMRLFDLPENKIKVIYPGVDTQIYTSKINEVDLRKARNIYNLPGKYLLFLNTIEPRKNLPKLICAFEQINDPECFLVIAGRPGWKNKKIFKDIKQSKKRNMIKYLGYLPEQDKPSVIKLSDALIYPSFYEGFGFQPLEAMALGVPVIVSQVTALPEVVGNAALLINPYNVGDLARAISEILTDSPLRQSLKAKGQERIKMFNWQNTARQILGFMNN